MTAELCFSFDNVDKVQQSVQTHGEDQLPKQGRQADLASAGLGCLCMAS